MKTATMTTTVNETTKTPALKTLCYSATSLNELLTELYATTSEVVFCEERELEVVRMTGREIVLEDAFEEIEARFNVEIESFDVMHLGELFGDAFVFFLK